MIDFSRLRNSILQVIRQRLTPFRRVGSARSDTPVESCIAMGARESMGAGVIDCLCSVARTLTHITDLDHALPSLFSRRRSSIDVLRSPSPVALFYRYLRDEGDTIIGAKGDPDDRAQTITRA